MLSPSPSAGELLFQQRICCLFSSPPLLQGNCFSAPLLQGLSGITNFHKKQGLLGAPLLQRLALYECVAWITNFHKKQGLLGAPLLQRLAL